MPGMENMGDVSLLSSCEKADKLTGFEVAGRPIVVILQQNFGNVSKTDQTSRILAFYFLCVDVNI